MTGQGQVLLRTIMAQACKEGPHEKHTEPSLSCKTQCSLTTSFLCFAGILCHEERGSGRSWCPGLGLAPALSSLPLSPVTALPSRTVPCFCHTGDCLPACSDTLKHVASKRFLGFLGKTIFSAVWAKPSPPCCLGGFSLASATCSLTARRPRIARLAEGATSFLSSPLPDPPLGLGSRSAQEAQGQLRECCQQARVALPPRVGPDLRLRPDTAYCFGNLR